MAAKTPAAAKDAPAPTGHYLVTCARPAGFRRGGRAWEPTTRVPAAEMTEDLLAALEGDPGNSFTVTGPHDDPSPADTPGA